MKDSQRVYACVHVSAKYIKESNERFSTHGGITAAPL